MNERQRGFRGIETPWITLFMLFATTMLVAYQSYTQGKKDADARFMELSHSAQESVTDALQRAEDLLRSTAVVVSSVPMLDEGRWHSYFDALAAGSRQRGIVRIELFQLSNGRIDSTGFARDIEMTVAPWAALAGTPAFEATILSAARTGQMHASAPLLIVRNDTIPGTANDQARYIALAVPLSGPDASQQGVSRFIVGYLRLDAILDTLTMRFANRLRFRLEEAGPDRSDGAGLAADHALRSATTLMLGQRHWRFSVEGTTALARELENRIPLVIVTAGMIATLLIAGLVWLLTRLREQASTLATSMTEKLRDSVKFSEDLIEFNPNPIFRQDAHGRFVAVNRAWELMAGRDRRDVLGKTTRDFLDPVTAAENERHERELFVSPDGYQARETFFASQSGNRYQTIVAKQVLRRLDGSIDGLIGTITDVTPIKQLEQRLERQQEQLDLVIRSSQQGIFDISVTGQGETYYSERFRDILGFKENDFPIAFSWDNWIDPEDRNAFRAELIRHFKQETPFFDVECRARHQQRGTVWVRVRALAQYGGDGRAVRFVGSIVDVTDRKEAEERLIEANVRVTEAARAKEAFLATMSHEIRTPLNGVIGMTGLLAETLLNDEQRDYIRLIRASGDTLLRLIDDVLDFSKIESGRMTLEQVPFEPVTIVEEASELVAEKAREKGVALIYDIREDVPTYLIGDPVRVRQILLNLLSNAIKFTEVGEIVCRITTQPAADGRLLIVGEVRDTGIGIPAERIGKLFQPFTQVDASTTRKYGGTGLGLAIVGRLTEMMGGSVRVESEEGKGSTFFFSLLAQPAKGPAKRHLATNTPELTGKRLLMIDDNAHRREAVAHIYRLWGLDVTIVGHAGACAALQKDPPYDIVTTDMLFPTTESLAFAKALQEHDLDCRHRNLLPPIVILHSTVSRSMLSQRQLVPPGRHDMFILRPAARAKVFDALTRAAQREPNKDVSTRPFTREPVYDAEFSASRGEPLRALAPLTGADAPPVIPGVVPLDILVAEDNEVNQRVIHGMLTRLGHRVAIARDGQIAIDMALAKPYELILMDIQMPVLDGVGAMRQIRARWPGSAPPPPIVAMTAHALSGDREQYLREGMDDYIAKPLRSAELTALLTRILPARKAVPPPTATNPAASAAPAAAPEPLLAEEAPAMHPSPSTTLPLLDTEQLEDLRGLPADGKTSGSAVNGLIDLFRSKTRERLAVMQNALVDSQWKTLAETSHSLRGAAASIGFPRVAAACKDLELAARRMEKACEGNATEMPPTQAELDELFDGIQRHYAEADRALDKWLASPAP